MNGWGPMYAAMKKLLYILCKVYLKKKKRYCLTSLGNFFFLQEMEVYLLLLYLKVFIYLF